MGSLAALLLAAAVRVPLGGAVTVTVDQAGTMPGRGQVVGDFLVAAPPRIATAGRLAVELRPLALGTLAVPLAGDPRPAVVEVVPALDAGAALAPPRAPALPFPRAWLGAAGLLVASAAVALLRRRRRRTRRHDPVAALRAALGALAEPAGWAQDDAADRVAHAVRAFLAPCLARPCPAMTTREVARELALELGPVRATPFVAALELADAARFAPSPVLAEVGSSCVVAVLDASAAWAAEMAS